MGTDIHPAIEVRRKGEWKYHRPKTPCPYYYDYDYGRDAAGNIIMVYKTDENGNKIRSHWDRCKYRLPPPFENRDYTMFSILANIRNDEDIPYIQDSRGYAPGMSPEARYMLSDEHSAGWVTLRELNRYPYWEVRQLDEGYNAEVLGDLRAMRDYMTNLIPKGGDEDDVRLVFDFDS